MIFLHKKKTAEQKIRDYFKLPRWEALVKKQKEKYGIRR